ncbi:MAG: HAD-IIA family hydrolase [Anaerolineales bacterium]|jgi:HAD superfamily hydrolase (TIGR01457 family)|nr:HAD-IIA family hydrolase [Anaerolineales bacterium]
MDRLAQVQCFLLDMDGTVFLGERLLEGAARFINVLHAQGKRYLFLTNNSSKHRRQYAEKLGRLGLPVPEELIFTSGEATALYLQQKVSGGRLYVVGTPALEEELREHGLELVQDQPQCVVLGFDTTLTYEKLWQLCSFVDQGLPYIATHPDINCPLPGGFMPDIGAVIAFVSTSTGREPDLVVGKPNRMMVERAAQKMGLPVTALGMVGDRLYTDIALGQASGIPAVLVLSGETRPEDLPGSKFTPDYIFAHLGEAADWLEAQSRQMGMGG